MRCKLGDGLQHPECTIMSIHREQKHLSHFYEMCEVIRNFNEKRGTSESSCPIIFPVSLLFFFFWGGGGMPEPTRGNKLNLGEHPQLHVLHTFPWCRLALSIPRSCRTNTWPRTSTKWRRYEVLCGLMGVFRLQHGVKGHGSLADTEYLDPSRYEICEQAGLPLQDPQWPSGGAGVLYGSCV